MKEYMLLRSIAPGGDVAWSCPTCKDEGTPARILSLEPDNVAKVWMKGATSEVALDLLDGLQAGDFILVHLDIAIARLNPEDVGAD